MSKTCVICGRAFEPNPEKEEQSICGREACLREFIFLKRRKGTSTEPGYKAEYWTRPMSKDQKRLNDDALLARELGISYGQLKALQWIGNKWG